MSELTFTSFSGTTKPTAFGTYDSDTEFQAAADKVVYFVQRKLGAPVMDSELDLRQIWTAFEQATLEWSAEVNKNHARNILLDMLGSSTGSLSGSEQIYVQGNSIEFSRKYSVQYSSEIGASTLGERWFTASITTVPDQQKYDLWTVLSGVLTGANDDRTVIIRKVHHYEPTAMYRFFDTTSVINYMGNELGFASYTPETIFYLLPIWEDVMRGMQLDLNQRVRRSNYSFNIQGMELMVYPTPTRAKKIYFEYSLSKDIQQDIEMSNSGTLRGGQKVKGVVSNISNVAFGHISYKDINSVGRTWIWNMTLAMCKEILGLIRSKYNTIPGVDVTLNGTELVNNAREEMTNLRMELRELLDQLTYKNLMSERQELNQAISMDIARVPALIYISK